MKLLLFTLCLLSLPVWVEAQTGQREAYHEMCHAIVAHELGAVVNIISLERTAEEAGQIYIYDRNLLSRQRAMVAIAGYVGERVFLDIDEPAGSGKDFEEAAEAFRGDVNSLIPRVTQILTKYQRYVPTLARELQQNRGMTGQQFRQLIGAPEPGPDHPALKAEGKTIGIVGGHGVHLGGKPPWAGDGWNQTYADWQDKFEGPLCFFVGVALCVWGVVLVYLRTQGRGSAGHEAIYALCLFVLFVWVGISTYIMYGTGPSN